ncbi:hypothetical protein ACLDXX_12595 [Acinetobacter baumannii]
MKLEDKIYGSIGLTVFLTIAYYYTYSFVDLYVSKLCDKHVCFEFPPYADFLAIWVAIIGLYFVVTSLDAWKHQDQYQTAKQNIKRLHEIADELKNYNVKLSNLNERYIMLDYTSSTREFKNTDLYLKYKDWIEKNGIKNIISDADHKITQQEVNLYQEDFNKLIKICHDYIHDIDQKIMNKDRKIVEDYSKKEEKVKEKREQQLSAINNLENTKSKYDVLKLMNIGSAIKNKDYPNMTQEDIDRIITEEHNNYQKFEKELRLLQNKLNKYIE